MTIPLLFGGVPAAPSPPPPTPPIPQPPAPPSYTPRITVAAYTRAGGLLSALIGSFERSWTDPLDQPGSGAASIGADDPDRANIPYRQLLRFSLDGTPVFQSLIEEKHTTALAPGEEVDEKISITGRGTLAIFEEACVYPYGGISHNPFSDKRVFDFSSPELNEGTPPTAPWVPSTVIKQVDSPFDPYGGAPANWPDHTAKWIWGVSGPPPYPVGFCYFKKRIFLPSETNLRFFVSADDGFDLRIDGAQLAQASQASNDPSYIWAKTTTADIWVDEGVHVVAIRGENVARPNSPSTNAAAVICSIYAVSAAGQLLPPPAIPTGPVAPIMTTDASWACQAYPATAPALHIGEVIHILFNEAKARGCFGVAEYGSPYADLGFSSTHDSAGVEWPQIELGFTCGASLLTVLAELSDTYVDFRMRPDSLILDAYSTLGTTPGVTLTAGSDISALDHDGRV